MKLYLVKMRGRADDEWFYKVGITQFQEIMHRFTTYGTEKVHGSSLSKLEQLRRAFAGEKYIHPYDVEVIHWVKFDRTEDAERIEEEILLAVNPQQVHPRLAFAGQTECFSADDSQINLVKVHMNSAAEESNAAVLRVSRASV